jgi:hypothetical protein
VLLQSVNHVVHHEVPLFFGKPLAESSHQLARPHERERNRKPEHVAAGLHGPLKNKWGT